MRLNTVIRALLAPVFACGFAVSALAQGSLLQGGPWAPGHAPMYVGQGGSQAIVQDSGPAGGGAVGVGMSEGLYAARGTGTPPYVGQGTGPFGSNWCDYDAPTTNATGYHVLCLSPDASGNVGLLSFGNAGGAAAIPFDLNINGTQGVIGLVYGTVTSGHAACVVTIGGITVIEDCGGTAGTGTVTSITCGAGLTCTPASPITTAGTITAKSLRTSLTGNITFYVNGNGGGTATCGLHGTSAPLTCSAGNDSNTCLTPASACLTTNHILALIYGGYDSAGFQILINGAHCSASSCGLNLAFACQNGPLLGNSGIVFAGDYDNPTAVEAFAPNSSYFALLTDQCTVSFDSIAVADQGSAAGAVLVSKFGQGDFRSVTLTGTWNVGAGGIIATGNAAVVNMLGAGNGGITNTIASTSIGEVFQATSGGYINFSSAPVAIPSAITLSGGQPFIYNVGGIVSGISSGTFTGSGVAGTTGPRCISFDAFWGNVDPNTAFPGNTNCAMNRTFNSSSIVGPTSGGAAIQLPATAGGDTFDLLGTAQTVSANKTFSGQIIPAYGTPTIASGACGSTTNGTLAAGSTNQSGILQIGSASTTACTVSFSATLSVAPTACDLFPANAAAAATGTTVAYVSAPTTAHWVLNGSALANANYVYHCF